MKEGSASERDGGVGSWRALPGGARPGLAIAAAVHALVFGVAAVQLPWPTFSWAAALAGAFAVAHLALATLSALGQERSLRLVWAGLSVASIALWLVATVSVLGVGLYLQELYRGLGAAVAGVLFVLDVVLASFTLPLALWGLNVTRPFAARSRRFRRVTGGALVLSVLPLLAVSGRGKSETVSGWGSTEPEALWRRVVAALPQETKLTRRSAPGLRTHALACDEPPGEGRLTALVTWLGNDGKSKGRCVQAESTEALESRLVALLGAEVNARVNTVVDFVTAHHPLRLDLPLLDAFEPRPARDGVCAGRRCLAPWQLVALDSFARYQPVSAVPDAKLGLSPRSLRKAFKDSLDEPLLRIETETFSWVDSKVERLSRLRRLRQEPEEDRVRRAVRSAERHILKAQRDDGGFRYTLNPYNGKEERAGLAVNLPRHAGTTLVLCELGATRPSRHAVGRALELLTRYERRHGALSVLSVDPSAGALGHTALPLVTFLSCRPDHGKRHDELIARLGAFLLRMQRSDGSFAPNFDPTTGSPEGAHQALYAAGQAVLALVLLEQQLDDLRAPEKPDAARLREAIDRAMGHYAERYWPRLLRDFFYLEENWHCLAARAALSSHRSDSYERFCLDYVAFKSRLILRPGEVESDLVGGFGVSPLFEPHNTGSAGFAEALAAALTVQRARGDDTAHNVATLRDMLGFLLRAQWDAASCFACGDLSRVAGGFSEHVASPTIRIDYVQHAMAALGHGGRELFVGS